MEDLEEENVPPIEYGENINHEYLFKDAFTEEPEILPEVNIPEIESHKNITFENLKKKEAKTFAELTESSKKVDAC